MHRNGKNKKYVGKSSTAKIALLGDPFVGSGTADYTGNHADWQSQVFEERDWKNYSRNKKVNFYRLKFAHISFVRCYAICNIAQPEIKLWQNMPFFAKV